jgi:DNA adenine methylase
VKLSPSLKAKRLSPLRYPGGKHFLAPYVASVIEENFLTGCTLYEPFAGGAAVSLELLRLEYIDRAVLIERDPLVYAFWHCVKHELDSLCGAIEAANVTIETWHELQPLRNVNNLTDCSYTLLQLGVAGLFFNRTNFSGVLGAGPIGGASQKSQYKIDCRFNKRAIVQGLRGLEHLSHAIEPRFGDALTWLTQVNSNDLSNNAFVYVDPPYFIQGPKLYRHFFNDAQHGALAKSLTDATYPWLLSYDDVPRIRELYSQSNVQPIYLDYRVKSSRLAKEIMISNLVIPPPVYEGITHTQEMVISR